MPGLFITFEGIDYSGKSLQCRMFCERLQKTKPVLALRDPGANRISEKIRAILLDKEMSEMAPITELLLYEAARSQMVSRQIKPALAENVTVVCDRFYDSTSAYQGYARGLDAQLVQQANRIGSCGLRPDHTFLLDIDPDRAYQRKKASGCEMDRIELEGRAFQTQVREGYLCVAREEPERISVIDGDAGADDIHQKIWSVFTRLFPLNWESKI